MSPFEDRLQSALRRKDPPAGFAERVLAQSAKRPRPILWWPTAGVAAAVAACVMAMTVYQNQYQQQLQERAGRQAVMALQIAAEKLNLARDQALHWNAAGIEIPDRKPIQKDDPQ